MTGDEFKTLRKAADYSRPVLATLRKLHPDCITYWEKSGAGPSWSCDWKDTGRFVTAWGNRLNALVARNRISQLSSRVSSVACEVVLVCESAFFPVGQILFPGAHLSVLRAPRYFVVRLR